MTDMRTTLAEKLKQVKVSPKFTAMLAYFLDEHWTDPQIVDMAITSDGMLLVGTTDDPLLDNLAGSGDDLWSNLRGVAKVAELTDEELTALLARARRKVRSWERSDA
jgi:hypothetical protein